MIKKLFYLVPALVLQAVFFIHHVEAKYDSLKYFEQAHIVNDRPFYLTGEYLRFAVYVIAEPAGGFSEVSRVAYVELCDSTGQPAIQAKIALQNGKGNGEFLLPMRLNSGNYFLKTYTAYARNFGSDYYSYRQISIVNPFKQLGLPKIEEGESATQGNHTQFENGFLKNNVNEKSISGQLKINLAKTNFTNREEVNVKVQLPELMASAQELTTLVSVYKYDPILEAINTGILNRKPENEFRVGDPKFLPEIYGPILTARATNIETKKPAEMSLIYLATHGKNPLFYTAEVNAKGYAYFEVNRLHDDQEVILQPDTDQKIEVTFQSVYCELPVRYQVSPFPIDSTWQQLITRFSKNMQYANAFAKYMPINEAKSDIDSLVFYGKPDFIYRLDDYTRFTVMEEVLREYVTPVLVRRRKDEFYFRIVDYVEKGYFKDPPLMLVDGAPVLNANQIMELNPLRIERIEVMSKKYYLGRATFSGIVHLRSYTGDLAGVKLNENSKRMTLSGLKTKPIYHWPVYKDGNENSPVPDFRNTLFWEFKNTEFKEGISEFNFYTSDDKGEYIIEVQVITEEGKVWKAKEKFNLK